MLRKYEWNIQDHRYTIKRPNVWIIGTEEEIQTESIDNLLNKIIVENFPEFEKKRDIQVHETYRTQNCFYHKRKSPRHLIIKTLIIQNKERKNAASKKRWVTYTGKPIRITADFSTQILNSRKWWKDIFKALKENNYKPRLVYPAKLSFQLKEKLKPSTTSKT
jgi:hypothetical protein